MSCALLVVDVQNDFLPGGALGVSGGDEVIPIINALQEKFDQIIATQDWHPANHKSFAANNRRKVGEVIDLEGLEQVMWPIHCVEETFGSAFPLQLHTEKFASVIQKGTNPSVDSYGAFFDNGHRQNTGLAQILKQKGIDHLYVVGLTTDYCVKATVIDGLDLGFRVTLVRDACRPVNLHPQDEEKAIEEMRKAGAEIITSDQLLQ